MIDNIKQIDRLVQDCSIASALVMGILQSFTKPLKCSEINYSL